jgi:hypothetical protein
MKKELVLALLLIIIGCTQGTQVANPASVYCEEQNNTLEIRDTPEGQVGYCVFEDGAECEEWSYYRGECTWDTSSPCKDLCGDGTCAEIVCLATGCPCPETPESCPADCI